MHCILCSFWTFETNAITPRKLYCDFCGLTTLTSLWNVIQWLSFFIETHYTKQTCCILLFPKIAMPTISTPVTISFGIWFLFWQTTHKNTFWIYLYDWAISNIWELLLLALLSSCSWPAITPFFSDLPCFVLLYFWYIFEPYSFSQFCVMA